LHGPRARIRRLNHDVVALTGSEDERVHVDGFDRSTIGVGHRHFVAGDPDTEDCRAAGVHESEANPLTLRYVERLRILWESTVDQEPFVWRPNISHHPASPPIPPPPIPRPKGVPALREVIVDHDDVLVVVLDVGSRSSTISGPSSPRSSWSPT